MVQVRLSLKTDTLAKAPCGVKETKTNKEDLRYSNHMTLK